MRYRLSQMSGGHAPSIIIEFKKLSKFRFHGPHQFFQLHSLFYISLNFELARIKGCCGFKLPYMWNRRNLSNLNWNDFYVMIDIPLNMPTNSRLFIVNVTSGGAGGEPFPANPGLFFRSKYQDAFVSSVTRKTKMAFVFLTISSLIRAVILLKISSTWIL